MRQCPELTAGRLSPKITGQFAPPKFGPLCIRIRALLSLSLLMHPCLHQSFRAPWPLWVFVFSIQHGLRHHGRPQALQGLTRLKSR